MQKSHFYGHLVRSNVYLKFLKVYVLWQCLQKQFSKTKNIQTLNVLLVKSIDKDFLDVKILIAKDDSSLNTLYNSSSWFSRTHETVRSNGTSLIGNVFTENLGVTV